MENIIEKMTIDHDKLEILLLLDAAACEKPLHQILYLHGVYGNYPITFSLVI